MSVSQWNTHIAATFKNNDLNNETKLGSEGINYLARQGFVRQRSLECEHKIFN